MKRTFIILTLATQLAAIPAFAQTTAATTGAGSGAGTYGSDWSETLRPALFTDEGTKVRDASEIASQWATLSDEDKDMIRRDCEMHAKSSDSASTTTGSTTGTTTGSATGSGGTSTATTDSTTGSTATTTDSAATGSTGATTGTTTDGAMPVLDVAAEQMDEICEATKDL